MDENKAVALLREGLGFFAAPTHTAAPADVKAPAVAGDSGAPEVRALEGYLHELVTWNEALGLTAARSAEELVSAHIFDSLAALPALRNLFAPPTGGEGEAGTKNQGASMDQGAPEELGKKPLLKKPLLGDIGSGAGFPGLPLAAVLRGWDFVLVERMEKRCDFLRRCVAAMHLGNVTVEQKRAEEATPGRFDALVFRALHPLSEGKTLDALLGLLKPGGVLAAYKARREKIAEELRLVAARHPDLTAKVVPLLNPWLPDHERHLVVLGRKL